jgi:hypothetical protein
MDPDLDQGEGQSAETEFDLDLSGFSAEEPTTGQEAESTASPIADGDNPKWAPFLEGIPTVMVDTIKAKLRELDRQTNEGFQKKAQEWEPYKPFRDQKIDPVYLQNSYQLAKALEENPVEILANLQQRLSADPNFRRILEERGLIPGAAPKEEQAADAFTAETPEQQIAALQKHIEERDQQLLAFFQQQQNEQIEQQTYAETIQSIDTDFATIESQIKQTLPQEVKAQIVQTAMVMGQQSGKYVSVIEAAPRVFQVLRSAQTGRRAAPRTIPTSGGNLPRPTTSDPADYTKDERVAAIQAMVANVNQQ